MAKQNRYKNAKEKRDGTTFISVPLCVLNGAAYLSLGAHARMLLFDLATQYRGDNNGDLCAPYSMMKLRGWKSTHTLHEAKLELIAAGLIVESRKGARPSKATLYALTWCALDECGGKLDISSRSFPRGLYRLKDPRPVLIEAKENASVSAATASGAR
ncbi:MAG: hypothetical protein KKH12_05400 [Gammaproteobacteria bacterium]|nr:hypothetical protein [Gammaproteobacteria bacterium]MBU1481095.1 hypothetical protein [Gammaproteobacteria bacterium]